MFDFVYTVYSVWYTLYTTGFYWILWIPQCGILLVAAADAIAVHCQSTSVEVSLLVDHQTPATSSQIAIRPV